MGSLDFLDTPDDVTYRYCYDIATLFYYRIQYDGADVLFFRTMGFGKTPTAESFIKEQMQWI